MSKANSDFLPLPGFVRVAVVSPDLRVADVAFNTAAMVHAMKQLAGEGVQLAVFPELGLTGYTAADLFYQPSLREAAESAAGDLANAACETGVALIAGLPVEILGRLYNAAVLITADGPVGIVPKCFLPNANEFYEERWFARGETLPVTEIEFCGRTVPVGTDLVFRAIEQPSVVVGIEICEDLWAVQPPSGPLALAGATIIANPSASDELLGKAAYRKSLVAQQSARCLAAYLYASSGPGESSTDLVYAGHGIIAENGQILAETDRFEFATTWSIADIDVEFLVSERVRNSSFSAESSAGSYRLIEFSLPSRLTDAEIPVLCRPLSARPFVPENDRDREAHSREVFAIQSAGLATRLRHLDGLRPVLGLSGGLDSTLAVLVCIEALKKLNRPASDVLAISMPGPGSTGHTQTNARELAAALGVELREIPIHDAVAGHLRDIGHPEDTFDVTYENAQARERTQILMNVANQVSGIVIGTGDLSESTLGWCTFNGDHMSMYHVNSGVPKTLVRYVIQWVAGTHDGSRMQGILLSICDTPITPELLPLSGDGALVQKTEDTLGSYELHDFFLYHVIRRMARPRRVFALACLAFDGVHSQQTILTTLKTFYRRFFGSQFKRSSMPDGPKVGTVALSPRGDWRMPSDASPVLWLAECEALDESISRS